MKTEALEKTRPSSSTSNASAASAPVCNYRKLRICCWSLATALGALDAWAVRSRMNPDGISYLDMGDAYMRGDWRMAINAFWSPLYSWILGAFIKILKPSPAWEYPLVHLVNFLIYVAALACFDFFMRSLIKHRRNTGIVSGTHEDHGLPEWALWVLGYSLFVWTSLVL